MNIKFTLGQNLVLIGVLVLVVVNTILIVTVSVYGEDSFYEDKSVGKYL